LYSAGSLITFWLVGTLAWSPPGCCPEGWAPGCWAGGCCEGEVPCARAAVVSASTNVTSTFLIAFCSFNASLPDFSARCSQTQPPSGLALPPKTWRHGL